MKLIINDIKAIARSLAPGWSNPYKDYEAWEHWYDYRWHQGKADQIDWENMGISDRIANLYTGNKEWQQLQRHPLARAIALILSPVHLLLFWWKRHQ